MSRRLVLGLTAGDPAGIGPEVILKALVSQDCPAADYVVYGPKAVFEARSRDLGVPIAPAVRFAAIPGGEVPLGKVTPEGGRIAAESALAAGRDALGRRIDAVVTAPLNKESLRAAGYRWPGHTELLAEVAGVSDFAMMFVGGGLRVALLTIHLPLREVALRLTGAEVERLVRLVDRELPRFRAAGRRIALCGLNPHAGEGGLFGREEMEIHVPALERLRAEGYDVGGPFPADTVFNSARRGEFDAVIANYHDQGLIPVKVAAFGEAVNVTLGLPFIRTSVDHGTGFDIVRKGVAGEGSMLAAMRLAAQLAGTEEGSG